MDVVAVAQRRVKERDAVCSDCGFVSSVTMGVTLFAKNVGSKLFGGVLEGLCNSPFPSFLFYLWLHSLWHKHPASSVLVLVAAQSFPHKAARSQQLQHRFQ